MLTLDVAIELLLDRVRELNGQLPAEERLALAPDTVLVGEGGTLDSLSLINLLVSIEEALLHRLDTALLLVDLVGEEEHAGTFATIESLAEWLVLQG